MRSTAVIIEGINSVEVVVDTVQSPIEVVIESPEVSGGNIIIGGTTYTFTGLSTWVIVHNKGYKPSVSCVDSTGEVFIPAINHVSNNEVHIINSTPLTGTAYIV